MKKILSNTKLYTPSKFVRKVLSRSSNTTDDNVSVVPTTSTTTESKSSTGSSVLELELTSLKEQMAILQLTVNSMHQDSEEKEKALINLENEKKELCAYLKREKRSSTTLKKQLQNERDFYYKEKEQYCQEMNDCKKLKKKLSETLTNKLEVDATAEILECKGRMAKLQDALNETLEDNYNLSVKFLKMKNTKTCLKKRLKQHDLEHTKAMENLTSKVNEIKNDLTEVVDKRFTLPMSSSNKKYLHVIKQNGVLMYENLCLQMKIDKLNGQVDEVRFSQFKKESKIKFKLLQKDATTQTERHSKFERTKVTRGTRHTPLPKTDQQSVTTSNQEDKTDSAIIKLFERDEKPGVPDIIMLPEDLPGIEFHELNAKTNFNESKTIKLNAESVSQFSTIAHCSSTQSILRAQSSPEVIMSSTFLTKHNY